MDGILEMSHQTKIAEIFKTHSKDILGVCYYVLKDSEASKDILMDTFEVALKKQDFHTINNPKSWLMQVAKNLSLKRFHKKIKTSYTDQIENISNIFMDNDGLEELIHEDQLEQQLIEEIGLLKPHQSKCIELFYLGKQSYQEIATSLELDIKTVKSHIQNGKRNLKLKLENKH